MATTPQQTAGAGSAQAEVNLPKPNALESKPDGKPRFTGCSKIGAYEVLSKLGEGTFGEVHKARSIKTGNFVALKKILMHNEKDGFPITALREIKLLKMLSHPNVLKLEEMAVEHRRKEGRKKASMYMVTPYMDHDLSGLLENPAVKITEPQIKCYMIQLLEGLKYLHAQQILHRDMKAANLLISNKGILQIGDFGLARPYDDDPPKPGKGGGEATRDYTTLVVTRWYRPPELLLQLRKYTTAIDMWGVGCVFGEMFRGRPILAGKSDLNQIELIFQMVGTPTEENMPGWSSLPGCEGVTSFGNYRSQLHMAFREQGSGMISLLTELLKLDWRKRINAMDALKHPYFSTPPLPLKPGEIPQFEESHELDRRKFRDQQAALPPAPAGGTVGIGPHAGEWGNANGYPGARRQHHGPPRNGYESRVPHHQGERRDRRPAWQNRDRGPDRGQDRGESSLPPAPAHGLPPRPANNASWSGWAGEQKASGWAGEGDRPPRNRPRGVGGAGGGSGDVDTYIPDYSSGGARPERFDRAPRHDRDNRGRDDRDRGNRDDRRRSRSPVSRMRENSKEVYGRR